jgi:hypothetical protein
MFAIDIEFKDGTRFEGLIYTWRPEKGWVEVMDETAGERNTVWLSEVRSGSVYSDRIRKNARAEDLLEKAKREGYGK